MRFVFYLKSEKMFMIFLALLAIVARIPYLDRSLWFDELLSGIRYDSLSYLWEMIIYDPPSPLPRVVAMITGALLGDNEILVRIPSVIFSVASVLFLFDLLKPISISVARLASIAFCLSPVAVWYGQEITAYSLTLFLLLASLWSLLRMQRYPEKYRFYGNLYAVLAASTFLSHFFSLAFVIPFLILSWSLDQKIRKRAICSTLISIVVGGGFVVFKMLYGLQIFSMGFMKEFDLAAWWMLFFNWYLHGNTIWTPVPETHVGLSELLSNPWILVVQIIFFILLLRSWSFLKKVSYNRKIGWSLLLLILPISLFVLQVIVGRVVFLERYVLFGLPFLFVLIAMGACSWLSQKMRVVSYVAIMSLSLFAYLSFVVKDSEWTVYRKNPDWKACVSYLVEHAKQQKVVVVSTNPYLDTLKHYLKKYKADKKVSVLYFHDVDVINDLQNTRYKRVILLEIPGWSVETNQAISWFEQNKYFNLAKEFSFTEVILRFYST